MPSSALDVPTLVKQTLGLILLIGIACVPGFGREVALGILIVTACGDSAWAIKSLAAGTMVTFISSPLAAGSGEGDVLLTVLKWLLLFVACLNSLLATVEPSRSYTKLMTYWVFITVMLLTNSLFVSALPSISIFKTVSFSLGLLCVIRLSMQNRDRNAEMLLFCAALGVAVVTVSLPLLVFAAGYSRNGRGFNGVFNHPQALGVFLVMTGAASFAAAFKAPRLSRILVVVGLFQWSIIYLTGARTALVAIGLGAIVYFVEMMVRGGTDSKMTYLSAPAVAVTIAGLMLVVTLSPDIREGVGAFLQKGDEQPLALGSVGTVVGESSRAGQIFADLDVAGAHPFFGYGFGVDPESEDNMDANGSQLGGIPISAPVEQGFLPLATVAQIGVVGSPLVLAFLFSFYRLTRVGSGEAAALFAAVVGVNFGEMIFYSVGGLGLLMWVLLSLLAVGGAFPQIPFKVARK
jgi:hypothetical protein